MFKLKRYFFKNIIKCISVFFISIILSGAFTVKVSGIRIEDLQGDLKKLYDDLTPRAQEKFEEVFLSIYSSLDEQNQKNFDRLLLPSLVSLFQIPQRNKMSFNFSNFLGGIINFLDSIDDPITKQQVAFLMGVCPIKENEEVVGFLVASKKMVDFTTKCKSGINAFFQRLGYNALKSKFDTSIILRNSFYPLKLNPDEGRHWSVRIKQGVNTDTLRSVNKTDEPSSNFPESNEANRYSLDFSNISETNEEFKLMPPIDNSLSSLQYDEMVEEFNPMDPSTYLKNTPNNNIFSDDETFSDAKILDYSNFGSTPINSFNCEEKNKEDFQFSLSLQQNLI